MMRGMEWLIASGLMVAVFAWLAELCHRLHLLRAGVLHTWEIWVDATHHRNDCLGNFAELLALLLPRGDMQPRALRRMVADSERALREHPLPFRGTGRHAAVYGEEALRLCTGDSLRRVENHADLRRHEKLQGLCERLNVAEEWQRQTEQDYAARVAAYNRALREPPARLPAHLLGFRRAGLPHALLRHENPPTAEEADGG